MVTYFICVNFNRVEKAIAAKICTDIIMRLKERGAAKRQNFILADFQQCEMSIYFCCWEFKIVNDLI